ncbi:aromatic acid exporter family protein (plasmid) [Pontibacillus sp. ALD_SL1]|uniref:FUSC family protein n=1 Tax=Pontibacillus sp. ALD_SL1 TaxID=2777185 RepID=UPI001A95C764|nr:aromatic acid exporter family protein [Pontibacillus sp. ALD_SL1]QST02997.1 aromatic acid exporter family protein [Pontibacillus sp. ALD_SL1]
MNIGARTFKTGIAVGLAVFIVHMLGLPYPAYAGVAAFLAVQPTVYRSYKTLLEQFLLNLLGASIALIALLLFGYNALTVGVVVMLLIAVNLRLGVSNMGISVLTAIIVLEIQHEELLLFTGERVALIMIGILSSLVINTLLFPPRYEKRLFQHLKTTSDHLSLLLRTETYHTLTHASYKKAVKTASENIEEAETLLELYGDEFLHKRKYTRAFLKKQITLLRFLALVKSELELVKTLETFRSSIHQLTDEEKRCLQQSLYSLTSLDEQLFLCYEGDIPPSSLEALEKEGEEAHKVIRTLLLDKEKDAYILLYASLAHLGKHLRKTKGALSSLHRST